VSFDLQKAIAGKNALRREIAARPVAEKLRMLDALRERELAIRRCPPKSPARAAGSPAPHRTR
jgi:hypothetical protein